MIEEQALVVEANEQFAWLEVKPASSCSQCSARAGCGTSLLQQWFQRKPNHLKVDNPDHVRAGNYVVVGIPEQALIKGSLLIYLLPIVALIIGGLAGQTLAMWLGAASVDIWSIIMALACLLLSLAWLRRRFSHQHRRAQYQPVILRMAPSYPFDTKS